MKKLLSIVLALTLALSLSVTAFAEGDGDTGNDTDTGTTTKDTTINQDSGEKNGSTTVNYSVAPAYTVTIPASVTIDGTNNSNTVTVSAEGVKVAKNQQVVVKLTGINVTAAKPSGDSEFKVTTAEGAELNYTVSAGGSVIQKDGTVLTVNPESATTNDGASGSNSLTFALAENEVVQYAGDYSGTVTFTVSVEKVSGSETNP